MVKKVAILGSCISRDNFNSTFNKNHKDFFEMVLHQHQGTILSLMSEKVPFIQDEKVNTLNDFNKWHLRTEHSKEFLSLYIERKPDYLLIDLYGDVYCGVVELENGNYFTYNPKFRNIILSKGNYKVLSLDKDTERYFSIWKEKTNELFSFLQKEHPQCKIILVKSRFIDTFKNGQNLTEIRKNNGIPTIDVSYFNSLRDMLDSYIINNFNVDVIDMTNKEYYLNDNHPWGQFYVHYTMDFYHDFFSKLQKIVFEDLNQQIVNLQSSIFTLEQRRGFFNFLRNKKLKS